jgi:tetratricopeptide (TPR) repeat protein
MSEGTSSPTAQLGSILFDQGRYPEAEKYFRDALAQDPNDPEVLWKLALCELNQRRPADAYQTINRAISLMPELAPLHAFKAYAEVELRRPADALRSAMQALELDPESDDAFTARAAAYISQQEWAKAEASAREALALNPDNGMAANQLAHALRLQNRLTESEGQIAYMLTQDPEDADTHVAAGWTALQKGRRSEAERHFLEALRLQPGNENARDGLKEAFRAKSPVYRVYLNYCFFMQRFTAGKQWLIIIGLFVMMKFAQQLPSPYSGIVIGGYLLFVLWVHVARPVGNFQLTLDRFARHALDRGEKVEAYVSGGGVMLGIPLLLAGVFAGWPAALIIGGTLVAAAFPFAYTFTNASAGRWLFGGVGAVVVAVGVLNLVEVLARVRFGSWLEGATGIALLAVVATTWLVNISALRRTR